MRFLTCLVIVLNVGLSGCDWVKDKIGGESQEERQKRAEQMKAADELVARWAERLKPAASGGFERHQGLTETDPWGNYIRISFDQEWFTEVATVRSAGPDGKFETTDDLTRTRQTSNAWGILSGISTGAYVIVGWLLAGVLSVLLSAGLESKRRRRAAADGKRKAPRRRHPVLAGLLSIVFAPLALLFYGFMWLGISLVDWCDWDVDFFDDFDIGGVDFDVDLDIDL
jgi:hypothetical protein